MRSGYDFATDNFGVSVPSSDTENTPLTVKGSSEWHRKLSLRYQRIREIYNNHASDLQGGTVHVGLNILNHWGRTFF